jgi:trehalose/maltose hydrolase-like predicted phosphorylase
LVHKSNPHLAALEFTLTAVNWSGSLEPRSGLDGRVSNAGVERYRALNSQHLEPLEAYEVSEDTIYLKTQTTQSGLHAALAARTQAFRNQELLEVERQTITETGYVAQHLFFNLEPGEQVTVEKVVSLYNSRDMAISECGLEARKLVARAEDFRSLLESHARTWEHLWRRFNLELLHQDPEEGKLAEKILRLHIFHLLQTTSVHTMDLDVGVPPRGWHGEAYRGHILWDELFIFPLLTLRLPEITRSLLMYRYRRLNAARRHAKEHGYAGAMFPWQTADDGTEETQIIHYNPVSGTWGPDESRRQRHVSIAVFINVWEYCERTGDTEFLHQYGAEMMLEIARFWASIATRDEARSGPQGRPDDAATGKYHIAGVMGPDEYHEALPGSEEPGVKDNAYTNIMVVWLIEKTLALLKGLPKEVARKLSGKIGFDPSETDKWRQMTKSMNVVMEGDIISQFDGFLRLEELDWDRYRAKHPSIHRMDRILKAEGDSPDKYKIAKQADVLMTYYLLSPEEVGRILRQLGHEVGDDLGILKANYEYYSKRTSHGSTLSKVVHAAVAKDIQPREVTWGWFLGALESDVHDTQGGTTTEGIHCAVMAGTLMLVIGEFAGVSFSGEKVCVRPALPEHWRRLSFSVLNRGVNYSIDIRPSGAKVAVDGPGVSEAVEVKQGGQAVLELAGGRRLEVDCRRPAGPAAT